MKRAFLSLGSNLGDRVSQLEEARKRLDSADARVVSRSSIYETEPQDFRDQPWFLNMAVEIETELTPEALLTRIHQIEAEMGRVRTAPKGPRIIDIDILFYGDAVIDRPDLQIPHPRLNARRFVLEPLDEIAPDFLHPVTHKTVREMLAALPGGGGQQQRLFRH